MEYEVWSAKSAVVKYGVWSLKILLRLSLKKNRLSREGHGRERLFLNYISFIFGKLPPPSMLVVVLVGVLMVVVVVVVEVVAIVAALAV